VPVVVRGELYGEKEKEPPCFDFTDDIDYHYLFDSVWCLYRFKKIEINKISDLTELFGYDFTNLKITAVYSAPDEDNATCVCVVLEDSVDDFINDEFVKSTGFFGDNGNEMYFNKLKSVFPDVCQVNYAQTENHGFQMKSQVVKSFFTESTIPCSVYWFSANIDNGEKVIIYGFFPFSVEIGDEGTFAELLV
jgi:hypothetical protein